MTTRPEVASLPFYTKRKLRQQVVIFTACPQRSGHLQDPKESLDVECLKKPSIPDFTSNSRAEGETKPLHQRRGKKGSPLCPRGEVRACPRGARPRFLALPVPPAPEGALPLWAGTCPFTTFGGSPIAQESNARSHHRHRECEQQGETRRPRELQESSETYSFPTACASRRGDVTGPGVQGGQAAGRRAAPPPRLRPVRDDGRDAPFLSGPAPHLVALGAGAPGLRGRLLGRGLLERLSPKACGGGANVRGRRHAPLPHHLPHPRERSKQAVAQGAGVGRQGCEVDFPQTLPPFPHVFIKSSPRVETTICSPPGACKPSGGRSQLYHGSSLPSGPVPGSAPGSAPTGPVSAPPRPRRLDPSPRVRPSGSRSELQQAPPAPPCPGAR
ncbi:translation initiation factor IF-2-like [Lutra lutra]|uniref:translation initiation factor IF-2-like n=1 Tax=Lutra lutra TaxID=9657 RepID=UPI001FD1A9B6|nr:translation initiation factor IF-2-like [Lutra lutra]